MCSKSRPNANPKPIYLFIDESLHLETEHILAQLNMSKNRYINEAIIQYNFFQKRQLLEEKLKKESLLVRVESLNVLKEFEKCEFLL